MKKLISIFALLSVSASLLTGCGGSDNNSSSTVKTTEGSLSATVSENVSVTNDTPSTETLTAEENEEISENISVTTSEPSTEAPTVKETEPSRNEGEILSAEDIAKRLNKIPDIDEIEIEGSDSFSILNFDDNYLSNVCFSLKSIDQSKFEGDTPVDRGTQCGGSVEVWATKESAIEREEFLAEFDGMGGGSTHIIVDTMIIRISIELNQEEHDRIQQAVIDALN